MFPSQEALTKALAIALDRGHAFAEVFAERTQTRSLSLDSNRLDKVRSGIDAGLGFRIINGEKTYYGFVNALDEASLIQLAITVSAYASQKQKPVGVLQLKPIKVPQHSVCELPAQSVGIKDIVKILQQANKAGRGLDKRIIQMAVRYADVCQNICIANTLGVLATDTRNRTRFAVEAVAQSGKDVQTGFEGPGGTVGLELLQGDKPKTIAIEAARRAILNLQAGPAPAGAMTVVLAGEAGGTMVHEACGHALEADFIRKKTSIFSESLGKKIVADCVSVVDDGTLPGYFGTLGVDDEGTLTKKNVLIENGVVRGFMSDYLNASLLNMPLSGNGRRESYRYAPIPRMTNTYIAQGTMKPQDIIASVKNGLYVKKMGGGQVDITNGNFVFEVTEGYLLKNGIIGEPVRGATLVGSGVQVLASVDMVGNDVHFIPGVCGKGQAAPVSDGQPTLRVPSLVVGGQA